MNEIVELEKLISKLGIKHEGINELLDDLYKKLLTEKYIKECMNSFIIEKGISNEYYESFRYKYASENIVAFSDTNLFPEYLKQLVDADNISYLKELINKIDELKKSEEEEN
jgi:hypothetical protein